MHNMMVNERIKRGEHESESFYETISSNDPGYKVDSEVDPAHQAITEEDELFERNAATFDLNNDVVDLDLRDRAR